MRCRLTAGVESSMNGSESERTELPGGASAAKASDGGPEEATVLNAGFVPLPRLGRSFRADDRYIRAVLHDQGGMGRVWVARDTSLDREIALKDLHPEFVDNPAVLARFLREAQITGQLEHPGIVPVYELARPEQGRPPFYTMRFVRGRT